MNDYDKQIEALEATVSGDAPLQISAPTTPAPTAPANPYPPQYPPQPPQYPPQYQQAPQRFGQPPMGRRYGFLCAYCSSRLEAVESMAGQSGTCPTCGNAIVIPILDSRGRLIDPTTGKVIKQDPHPVHAYAAAGHKAPQIVTMETTGERYIRCPRCNRQNTLASNNCLGCGLPFTMEGTVGDSISGTNTWAVASLVLGIVSVAGGCVFVIPPILAIVFGFIAMRTTNQATGQSSGQGLAITGMILGTIGLVIGGLMLARVFHT